MNLRAIAKDNCPPVFLRLFKKIGRKNNITFAGNYASWAEAGLHCTGYDTDAIFQAVREAALKVKRGEAAFERDSVCFYHEEFRWPALASMLTIAAERGGKLNVLDFGGAFGSFYFQHRKFLSKLQACRWAVVEQKHFVEFGRAEIQDNILKFYKTIDESLKQGAIDVVFVSSVLQYLDLPYEVLAKLGQIKAPYLLIDRTPFIQDDQDRLTIQEIPEAIYQASYPAWFFSREKFDAFIAGLDYRLMVEFSGDDAVGIGEYKGLLYERN